MCINCKSTPLFPCLVLYVFHVMTIFADWLDRTPMSRKQLGPTHPRENRHNGIEYVYMYMETVRKYYFSADFPPPFLSVSDVVSFLPSPPAAALAFFPFAVFPSVGFLTPSSSAIPFVALLSTSLSSAMTARMRELKYTTSNWSLVFVVNAPVMDGWSRSGRRFNASCR